MPSGLKLRLIFVISCLLAVTLSAQQYQFKRITTQQGLSNNSILSIYQDRRGFIWFGTFDGLNRYDGYNIRRIAPVNQPEIPDFSSVHNIVEDDHHQLWLGTDEGLYCLNLATQEFHFIDVAPYQSNVEYEQHLHETYNMVSDLYLDGDNLWLVNISRSILLINVANHNVENLTVALLPALENNKMEFSCITHYQGKIIIGAKSGGLLVVDQATSKFKRYDKGMFPYDAEALLCINQFFWNSRNQLWIATSEGPLIFRPDHDKPFTILESYQYKSANNYHGVVCITEDNYGNMWFGSDNQGATVFNPQTKQCIQVQSNFNDQRSLPSSNVPSLFKDRQGTMWVGTWQGVAYAPKSMQVFRTIRQVYEGDPQLTSNLIWSVFQDSHRRLWIGTDNGGVVIDSSYRTQFSYLCNNAATGNLAVQAFAEDDKGNIWLGTSSGLYRVQNGKQEAQAIPLPEDSLSWKNRSNWIRSLYYIDGSLYIGNMYGLSLLECSSLKLQNLLMPTPRDTTINYKYGVYGIKPDKFGRLWLAVNAGLFSCNLSDNSIEDHSHVFPDSKQSFSHFVRCLAVDNDGSVWLGTRENGLIHYNINTRAIDRYTKTQGLPTDWISLLEKDDAGDLWLGTLNGLVNFNNQSEQFSVFQYDDGLPDNEFNQGASCTLHDGRLAMGGMNGLTIFDPALLKVKAATPAIQFTQLSLAGRPLSPRSENHQSTLVQDISYLDEITIAYDTPVFSLQFSALDFSNTANIAYFYRMKNENTDWNSLGPRREITFTSLSPGTHQLEIQATNIRDMKPRQYTTMTIVIPPPFWMRHWFRWTSLIAGLSILYLIYLWRVARLQRHQIYLEAVVSDRTRQLENELKNRLAAEGKLQKYTGKLEEMVAEKTHQLLEMKEKEFHLEKLAAIGRATSGIVHELRNPLSSIKLGLTTMTRRIQAEPRTQQCLDIAVDNVQRMESMLTDMLNFSKPQQIRLSSLQPDDLIKETVVRDIKPVLRSSIQIDLSLQFNDWIVGDAEKLKQILKNTINNSAQSMPEGGIINIRTQKDKYGFLELDIEDQGSGIPDHDLPRIFDPYFTQKVGGTGLGLTIVHKIVKAHKGNIKIESRSGRGTCVKIVLPCNVNQLK